MKGLFLKLQSKGWKINKWGNAMDKGNYRVWYSDEERQVCFIEFTNPVAQVIVTESSLDYGIGLKKILKTIEVLSS